MAMVLCTGWDQSLLDTRTFMLRSAGHEVHQARTQNEVASACKGHQFDVAVIGQSLSNRMKPLIASLVKQECPYVSILELYQPHLGKTLPNADSWLEVPSDVPSDLVERVNELADRREKLGL